MRTCDKRPRVRERGMLGRRRTEHLSAQGVALALHGGVRLELDARQVPPGVLVQWDGEQVAVVLCVEICEWSVSGSMGGDDDGILDAME